MPDISAQQHLLPLVVIIVMTAIGLELRGAQFVSLARSPRMPALGTLLHTILFPLIALLSIIGANLAGLAPTEAVFIGILVIAACPSGGYSNVMVFMNRGDLALSVTLTSASSLLSFATVPLWFLLFGIAVPGMAVKVQLPVAETLMQVLLLVVAPILAGMALRMRFPGFAQRAAKPIQKYAQLALYAVVALLIYQERQTIADAMGELLLWSVLLYTLTLLGGYSAAKLTGLNHEQSVAVSCESACRNLAVAFVVAANVLERMDVAVLSTIYFIVILASTPLLRILYRRLGQQ